MLLAIAVCPLWRTALVGVQSEQVSWSPPCWARRSSCSTCARRAGTRSCTWPRSTSRSSSCSRGSTSSPAASSCAAISQATPAHQHGVPGRRRACSPRFVGTTGASMLLIRPLLQTNRERRACQAHRHLLHLPRVERRRHADAARRSAAVPRLSAGRAVHVDVPALAPVAAHDRRAAASSISSGTRAHYAREPPARAPARPRRGRAAARPGRAQRRLGSRGVVLAVAFLHAPWREVAIVRARRALAAAHAAARSDGANGFTVVSDGRGGGAVLRDLPHDDPGPRSAARCAAPSSACASRGSSSGRPARCRRSSTTRRRTSRSSRSRRGSDSAHEVVGVPHAILAAISVGAVAMGANTYIGNAPNFMVKAIAEEAGVTHAELRRVHALQRGHPDPAVRRDHAAVFPVTAAASVLVLPGYGDSGPEHWQSLWEAADPRLRRVAQQDWLEPKLDDWLATLDREVSACATPPLLVAHSLGCALVAHWVQRTHRAVRRRPPGGAGGR